MKTETKTLEPIYPKTTRAYQYIKEGLKSGRWLFGQDISVVEVANELQFSRRPVIDALRKLEMEYFVEIIPQTGCRVKTYSHREIFDHFLTVMALEGVGAWLAAQRRNDDEIETLHRIHEELKEIVIHNVSQDQYFEGNQRFHYTILKMARSEKLLGMAQSQWDLSDVFLVNLSLFERDLNRTIKDHELLIQRIADGDSDGARSLMEQHIYQFALLANHAR